MNILLVGLSLGSSVRKLKMFLTLFLIVLGTQTSITQKPASESTDVVLLIDSSNALGRKSFPSVKSFVNRVISSLPVGPNKYRIALVQYSDDVQIEFRLDDYKGRTPMLNYLKKNVLYRGGSLRTGNAIQKVHETFFEVPRNDRNQVVVVTTSGLSEDDVKGPAKRLQDDGIKIIALGMQAASAQELQSVATQPFFYNFATPKDLAAFSQNMSTVIGEAIQMDNAVIISTPSPPSVIISTPSAPSVTVNDSKVSPQVPQCLRDSVADIVFVVDEGVSHENSRYVASFLSDTINSLDVKEGCIQTGLVTYSTEPQVISLLKTETNKTDILQKIQTFSPRPGKSNLGAAINITRKRIFDQHAGSRKTQGVEQIATVVTHRSSNDSVSEAATLLRQAGVTVFAIGIEGANATQLTEIASYPPERNVIKLPKFSDLPSQTKIFQKKLFNRIQHTLYVQSERRILLKTGCMDTEEADIYFLIDGSSSIHWSDFNDMKNFLKEVVNLFNVGPDHVRFGVVQYSSSSSIKLHFKLDDYTKRNSLEKAINNINQLGGDTYTGKALIFMLPLFEKARQQRGNKVPCHLVVLTDGEAHDNVKIPAEMLRNAKVNIYAIGVKDANKTQLHEIAGSRVYSVQQFDSLKDIQAEIVRDLCTEEACKEMKADIMFLVDSSGSIGYANFNKMKNFMSDLVNKSDIGLDQVRIGVVQFSGNAKEEFPLNKYSAKSDIIDAIETMVAIEENTLTGQALEFVAEYFKQSKGSRSSVNKILILLTDGEAQDEVKTPAMALREGGITIYSVGVFNANKTQLEEISGKPELVFYVENFDVLEKIEGDIIFGICNPYDECKRLARLDVVFVIDSSGSIGDTNYRLMQDFMIGLVNKSDVGSDRVQFGALKYSDSPVKLFYLNAYNTKSAIISAIQSDTLLSGNTYTAQALTYSESFFAEEHGSRHHRKVPQVLIVITDGESHDADKLDEVSKRLRARDIQIYAIGIKEAKTNELQTMAGPNKKYYFVDQFEGLGNITTELSDELCNDSKPECEVHADLVFLIDGSRSIWPLDFDKMKTFLKELLDQISYNKNMQVGMAQFSDNYNEEFPLHGNSSKSELQEKISNVSMMKGESTYIGKALKEVKTFFSPSRRRITRHIQPMLLVITDGESDDEVAQPAEDLRKEGVEIYAIGVGEVKDITLQKIAGSPERKYKIANFPGLKNIKKRITNQMCNGGVKAACFVDIVMGFDISSQKPGDPLFHGHPLLEAYLPKILEYLITVSTVSCSTGTKTQFSVAISQENMNTTLSSDLQVDHKKIMEELRKVTVKNPSHLNVAFLGTLWKTFENLPHNEKRSQVLLLFSDGLDDDVKLLQQKSEEFRKKGLDGLIMVTLEGTSNFHNFQHIEFGKGFGYTNHLTIGSQSIAKSLFEYMAQIAERTCCCVFCTCMREEGPAGPRGSVGPKGYTGINGIPGYVGDDGEPGPSGPPGLNGQQGYAGCQGDQGEKGQQGWRGKKGDNGIDGVDGINGEEGSHGLAGPKGEKGDPGLPGITGSRGLPGEHGPKGFQGDPGNPGVDNHNNGATGPQGLQGNKGERGPKGLAGPAGPVGNEGAEGQRGSPGPPGENGAPGPDGLPAQQGFQGPQGEAGIPGMKGLKGSTGNRGLQGSLGKAGPKGDEGKPGPRGNKGETGDPGKKGEIGPRGQQGMKGDAGTAGYGRRGRKGSKGHEGCPGDTGIQGETGGAGISGEPGPKGNRGKMGPVGETGIRGAPGERGYPGRLGAKGTKGLASFLPCELIEYVREHSPCWEGAQECPVYPTELVFALDISQDTTLAVFERMREILITIVNNTRIRESNCPVGARVAVVSYNSNTHHLIRFSDFKSKKLLLQELRSLSYQRSSSGRDIGGSMRFVARNVFKRTLPGANMRKVAVFFSNGQSANTVSINTAVLEFSALDILPVVIAFKNVPEVNRAFSMDDSGLFQVINIHQEGDYTPAVQRFQLCILCYDKCRLNTSCLRDKTSLPPAYVDAAFVLESSRKVSPLEFVKLKDFLSLSLDNFDISAQPESTLIGDRVAVLSHAPPDFRPQTQKSPVKIEFDLVAYESKEQMKRHIQESIWQLNGTAALGHAIQWTITNVFTEASNQRKHKALFVISVGETSRWDKEVLKDAALRAKCQGYALFVVSLGHDYDSVELGELASRPMEHHLVQLGRCHKAELGYAVKFLKPFLRLLRNEINSYPPAQLRRRCSSISTQEPIYVPLQSRYSFAMDETKSKRAKSRETGPAVLEHLPGESVSPEHFISSPQQIAVRKSSVTILCKNTYKRK
ncbi:collagen alpha-6(VI) chain-like [Heteronotia binoei]|uniref:collagen alpha-6(VI) chain-like n=1 Tax=Heteronotia binoei TaxID=13085 RepID=UPI002931005B|nr:collagen alpha-6(VI) chain-like [Heteronotia binoei]